MQHPQNLLIKDFSYDLPEEFIAKFPLEERDRSKLLVYKNGKITEDIYLNLGDHLTPNSLLVFNDTKVIKARILFTKFTRGVIEIFCLEPDECYKDVANAMMQKQRVTWKCLAGGAKKWKEEPLIKKIQTEDQLLELTAKKLEKRNDYFLIQFSWNNTELSFAEVLHYAGAIPLPPYLNRSAEESDKERYQTIYAKHEGSVAAPTAGLHFTERLFKKLANKQIHKDFVTLHVGAGTFKPVKSETLSEHEMHAEFIDVRKELVENLLNNLQSDIVAAGTTSLRTIESLYWLGVKTKLQPGISPEQLHITQWEVYEFKEVTFTKEEAFLALLAWMQQHKLHRLITKTQIIIAPGYKLKIAKGLITNFHQPQSTLLLLIASIVDDNWRRIYNYALQNNYRFLSYGDGCLIYT